MISRDVKFSEDCFGQQAVQKDAANVHVLEFLHEEKDRTAELIPEEHESEDSQKIKVNNHDDARGNQVEPNISSLEESNENIRRSTRNRQLPLWMRSDVMMFL